MDDKQGILDGLLDEYKTLTNRELDRKLELGEKIKSVRMELDKTIKVSM